MRQQVLYIIDLGLNTYIYVLDRSFLVLSSTTKPNKVMYQSNERINVTPWDSPGHLNFLKIFVQIPLAPGQKAV